jgi:hypothetical protein
LENNTLDFKFYEQMNLALARQRQIPIVNERFLMLYHGTSQKNHTQILKTNKFKMGTWFTPDREIAEKYAAMTGTRKTMIIYAPIYAGGLFSSGDYFTSNTDLYFSNSVYAPAAFKFHP